MQSFITAMDNLPQIIKIILAIFADIIWCIYRLCASIEKKNTVGIVLAIIVMCCGFSILWIIDTITIILKGTVLWID